MIPSKKEISSEDYGLALGQGRDLARLTDKLVEKEYKYTFDNNDAILDLQTKARYHYGKNKI